jgi:hypothetical protein
MLVESDFGQDTAPTSSSDGVSIPRCWSDVFTKALLNPGSFEWAKKLLKSKAWTIILKEQTTDKGFSFSIPQHVLAKL